MPRRIVDLSIYLENDDPIRRPSAPRSRTRGVRLTGTDAWGWDAPFVYTAEKYKETKDASLIWEGHKAGRDIGWAISPSAACG